MKAKHKATWASLKKLALALDLPGVEETTSWGQPTLKAHKKLWVWWSPHEDAPVFKVPFEEREILVESDPETFFFTDHYKNHALVLVHPDRLDPDWARANLLRVWRAQAPKRVLKAFDEGHGGSRSATGASPLPGGLTGPARQALEDAGYMTLEHLAGARQTDIAQLRGVGPAAIRVLKEALGKAGLSFAR